VADLADARQPCSDIPKLPRLITARRVHLWSA
jgi:hypothetical protein